jgi:hypothetical protein
MKNIKSFENYYYEYGYTLDNLKYRIGEYDADEMQINTIYEIFKYI